ELSDWAAVLRADYRIEPDGTVVVFLTERATKRAFGPNSKIGARLAFKTRYETAQFVRAGEAEGYTFEGKEVLAQASKSAERGGVTVRWFGIRKLTFKNRGTNGCCAIYADSKSTNRTPFFELI